MSIADQRTPLNLVRDDLREFAGYRAARSDKLDGRIWLNANESPWANPADIDATVRRYPDPQPAHLRELLASLYGCRAEQLLAGRGRGGREVWRDTRREPLQRLRRPLGLHTRSTGSFGPCGDRGPAHVEGFPRPLEDGREDQELLRYALQTCGHVHARTPQRASSAPNSACKSEKPSTRSGFNSRMRLKFASRNELTLGFLRASGGRTVNPETPTTRSPAPIR
jgi:hypothetical protein